MPHDHVIDLVDDDDDEEQYDSIPLPDDIEAIENAAGPSRRTPSNGSRQAHTTDDDGLAPRQSLREKLAKLDGEIKGVREQIKVLQRLERDLSAERTQVEHDLGAQTSSGRAPNAADDAERSGSARSSQKIDYQASQFPWSDSIKAKRKNVFGISAFRLCQEGVINAALDDRDIVCVMPTGGGKSLTYQLPAIIGGEGLTVVISPLLALIWDQVRALKELDIECVMLTGNTSKEEQNAAYRQMEQGVRGGAKPLRLCYVTPEKIAKSKRFVSILEKVHSQGHLNEAHCCSQLGHDFRPDYKQLSKLRILFPRVPIQAVTATLSSRTLPDLLRILKLPQICDGRAADRHGTVFFSAPLYRPNLHYQVQIKPTGLKAATEKMGSWIKENHLGESGIIYCLSKKDAEVVADELSSWSGGQIRTGVYHAGCTDYEKERMHKQWRAGKLHCICATIAFGLGIDKGDVRYVIHHSMSKSLDGYYQETGRAGRDGKDSDCILFYRGQDATRLSSLIVNEAEGQAKLQEMLRFAQDLKTCRKIAFAKYFSTSAQVSANAWDHADALGGSTSGSVAVCGKCDNCSRDPDSVVTRDVTLDAWRILQIAKRVEIEKGRVTLANLADLVRGLGGGAFAIPGDGGSKKRKAEPEKGRLDIVDVAGGKVELNKEDTETLLIHMILLGYLADDFHQTAYAVNVYVRSGPKAIRLSRYAQSDISSGSTAPSVECTFPAPKARKTKRKESQDVDTEGVEADPSAPTQKPKPKSRKKREVKQPVFDEEKDFARNSDDELDLPTLDATFDDADGSPLFDDEEAPAPSAKRPKAKGKSVAQSKAPSKRIFKSEEVLEVSD